MALFRNTKTWVLHVVFVPQVIQELAGISGKINGRSITINNAPLEMSISQAITMLRNPHAGQRKEVKEGINKLSTHAEVPKDIQEEFKRISKLF